MKQISWGIIGCGSVTEMKSGPAFGKTEGSRIVAVMRRDAAKAKDYAARHGVPRWYHHAGDLINDPEVNAIYIATPPSSHARFAIQAMENGKIAYVEKPMAANYADCIEMNRTALKTGMPLYVAYYRRYLPYFIKVYEIIHGGELGKLLFVQADLHLPARPEDYDKERLPWRIVADVAGGGYFYDLACHQLDLFEWFFGPVKQASGNKYNRGGLYSAEDTVFASLEYGDGIPIAAGWCFVIENHDQRDVIKVFGSRGTLEFSTFGFTPIKLLTTEGESEFLPPNPENIQYWFIRNMILELQGANPGAGNGESAARTNRVMDEILGKI